MADVRRGRVCLCAPSRACRSGSARRSRWGANCGATSPPAALPAQLAPKRSQGHGWSPRSARATGRRGGARATPWLPLRPGPPAARRSCAPRGTAWRACTMPSGRRCARRAPWPRPRHPPSGHSSTSTNQHQLMRPAPPSRSGSPARSRAGRGARPACPTAGSPPTSSDSFRSLPAWSGRLKSGSVSPNGVESSGADESLRCAG